jgi:hypothetical protein
LEFSLFVASEFSGALACDAVSSHPRSMQDTGSSLAPCAGYGFLLFHGVGGLITVAVLLALLAQMLCVSILCFLWVQFCCCLLRE